MKNRAHRDEPDWSRFKFNQPYAEGLRRLRDEVLGKTDFDPAPLWLWGTMQAMAVIGMLKACEAAFGAGGQRVIYDALRRVGHDVGRQVLKGTVIPEGVGEAQASFDILWCPHQDTYKAFDCRVQRYFAQGMIDALREHTEGKGFNLVTGPGSLDVVNFMAQ